MADQFFRIRLDTDMRRLLDRLRDEKDINLSRWVQRQVRNALGREFPDNSATETQKKPPIDTTETQEHESPQTPTIGTRDVTKLDQAAIETQKKPPIDTTETQEHESPQTPTIGTRDVTELDQAAIETQKKPPIDGWKPRRMDSGKWGAVLEGEKVAELPDSDQLPGTAISVTDSKGDSWTTTIVAVVSRTDAEIMVTTAGRPRD